MEEPNILCRVLEAGSFNVLNKAFKLKRNFVSLISNLTNFLVIKRQGPEPRSQKAGILMKNSVKLDPKNPDVICYNAPVITGISG
jgi:hypothetical protein